MPMRKNVSFSDVSTLSSVEDVEVEDYTEPADVQAFVTCEPLSPPSPQGPYDPTLSDVFGFRNRRRRQPAGFSQGRSLLLGSASAAFENSALMQKRRVSKEPLLSGQKASCSDETTSKDAPVQTGNGEGRENEQ